MCTHTIIHFAQPDLFCPHLTPVKLLRMLYQQHEDMWHRIAMFCNSTANSYWHDFDETSYKSSKINRKLDISLRNDEVVNWLPLIRVEFPNAWLDVLPPRRGNYWDTLDYEVYSLQLSCDDTWVMSNQQCILGSYGSWYFSQFLTGHRQPTRIMLNEGCVRRLWKRRWSIREN